MKRNRGASKQIRNRESGDEERMTEVQISAGRNKEGSFGRMSRFCEQSRLIAGLELHDEGELGYLEKQKTITMAI